MNKLRLSIKWKIFFLIAALISSTLLVVFFSSSKIFREDKDSFVRDLNSKLVSSTAGSVQNRIATLQDKLLIFISFRESLTNAGVKATDQLEVLFSRYSEFLAIGLLTPEEGHLKTSFLLRNPKSQALSWPADYERTILSMIDAKPVNGIQFWDGQAPDGSSLAVVGFKVQVPTGSAWVVGILPPSLFDDQLSDFSTGLNTAMIVDGHGTAISHSEPNQRWKNQSRHPLVAEALKGTRPSDVTDTTDTEGHAIIGGFQAVPKTTLYAIISTPRDKAFEAANILLDHLVYIGLSIMVVAVALAIVFSNLLIGPLTRLRKIAAEIGAGNFNVPVDVKTNDEIGELAESFAKMEANLVQRDEALQGAQTALVQSEKMSAFGQLSAGIAHEVKNPLAGILGHAQLAMGKQPSDEIKKHLEVIEKETRRCKAIVENLMRFARQEKAEMKPTDLAQVVQDTINLVDHQLSLAGCKIIKEIQECPMVQANANQLQQVLLNLMVNASHAMEKSAAKNVIVRVLQRGRKAEIQVEDTGSGIPPEIQKKIFEPFFTTKPIGKGTGLGLSVGIGIVKEHRGEIHLKSEVGKGTTFSIYLPIGDNAIIAPPPPARPAATPVPKAFDLPKMKKEEPPAPVPEVTHTVIDLPPVDKPTATPPSEKLDEFRVQVKRPKMKV